MSDELTENWDRLQELAEADLQDEELIANVLKRKRARQLERETLGGINGKTILDRIAGYSGPQHPIHTADPLQRSNARSNHSYNSSYQCTITQKLLSMLCPVPNAEKMSLMTL